MFSVGLCSRHEATEKNWTFGVWSKSLGLKTTSSITKILNGERDPGPQITEQLIAYFKFSNKQAQYFRDLIQLKKIRHDPNLCVLLMEKMGKDHPSGRIRILDDKSFLIISNWYFLALRELCRTRNFREDPAWISEQFYFPVSAKEISAAIKTMLEMGLLKREKSGDLKLAEGRLDTTNDIASEAIKRYHEQMLENAKTALRKISVLDREMSSTTLVMRSENIQKAKILIRNFREKFEKLLEEDDGDVVMQLQLQMFPVSKTQGGDL